MEGKMMRAATADSFWVKVNKDSSESGCWLWTRGLGRGGYGKVTFRGKTWSTHRLAWTLTNGVIPDSMQLNHSCDNRLCCNPDHLKTGTQKQNIEDAVSRGRMAVGDRQGLRKHPESAPHGERNGSAKLTESQALEIFKSGDRRTALADRFKVSISTIHFIKRGRIWKRLLNQAGVLING